MCKFLTGSARIQQTEKKRTWKLLDNEIFKANDGTLYLAPRNMLSDNYTIPMWTAVVAGSPVDFDTRGSHVHDLCCYAHRSVTIALTEKELRDKGYLRYSEKNKMWVCEDIPSEYLRIEKISKIRANNLLYECMEASGVPFINRIIIRIGVAFNIGWILDSLFNKIIYLDLDEIYSEKYWRRELDAR